MGAGRRGALRPARTIAGVLAGALWLAGCGPQGVLPRPVEPRFAGEFSYVDCSGESLACDPTSRPPARALRAFAERAPAGAEAERKLSLLPLLGQTSPQNLGKSTERLARALARHPESSSLWNDYAVALLLRFRASGSALDLFQALEAIGRAEILDPSAVEPAFNRGLIAETLGLRRLAKQAWRWGWSREPDRSWSEEIASRIDSIEEEVTDQVAWGRLARSLDSIGDSAAAQQAATLFPWRLYRYLTEVAIPQAAPLGLANERSATTRLAVALSDRGEYLPLDAIRALVALPHPEHMSAIAQLGQVLRELDRLEVDAAAGRLEPILPALQRFENPLWLLARLARINVLLYSDSRQALRETMELGRDLDPQRHPGLAGRLAWVRGTLLGRGGDYRNSFESYAQAAATFEEPFGHFPAPYLRLLQAEIAVLDGRAEEAWPLLREAVSGVSLYGSQRRLHSTLMVNGMALERAGMLHAARLIYEESVLNAEDWADTYGVATSVRKLAVVESRLHLEGAGLRLEQSRKLTEREPDATIRRLTSADLELERSELLLSVEAGEVSGDWVPTLDSVVALFQEHGSSYDEVLARLILSRVQQRLGDHEEALASIRRAVRLLADGRVRSSTSIGPYGVGLPERVARQETSALLSNGLFEQAMLASERARLLAEGFQDTGAAADEVAQPASHLAQLPKRLVTLAAQHNAAIVAIDAEARLLSTITSQGIQHFRLTVSASALRDWAKAFRTADSAHAHDLARVLSGRLLPADFPTMPRTLFVPDRSTRGVPFHALYHPLGGRLIDHGAVGIATTLSMAAMPATGGSAGRPLVVLAGDSESGAPLEAASRETRLVANLLGDHTVLRAPSVERLTQRLSEANVFHFAGHLRTDPLDPYRQELLLGGGARLPAAALLELDLSSLRLAVLSSCASSVDSGEAAPGPSYSNAFLRAGASVVVGTLWPTDDRSAAAFGIAFHRAFANGEAPIDAMRSAYLEMSDQTKSWTPTDWMAFRIEGRLLGSDPSTPK